MNPRLSLVVIIHNEVDRLGRCLESIRDLADEIIVVDSGSTDGTQEVAESFGVRWFERAPFPGWEAQKQWAMEQAEGGWILSLDADEWLLDDAIERIRRALKTDGAGNAEGGTTNGFRLTLKTFFLGRWLKGGNSAREKKIRLVRSGRGRWTGGDPHDRARGVAQESRGSRRVTARTHEPGGDLFNPSQGIGHAQ